MTGLTRERGWAVCTPDRGTELFTSLVKALLHARRMRCVSRWPHQVAVHKAWIGDKEAVMTPTEDMPQIIERLHWVARWPG